MIKAQIIADSVSEAGKRLTTLQLCYPRLIHSELMTHRVFSRNASSSRAIPIAKVIEQVRNDPAMPIQWGKNQPGMQAHEDLTGVELTLAQYRWRAAAHEAADSAESMMKLGLHKQVVNRILEPFQWIHVVLTTTEFDNWDELRDHTDADPTIHELARQIKIARVNSQPMPLSFGEWHLPYVTEAELSHALWRHSSAEEAWALMCKVSAARCCRVSYLKHDGHASTIEEDLALCDRLAGARPIHASPFEHQATPMPEIKPQVYFNGGGDVEIKGHVPEGVSHIDMSGSAWSGNLNGWIQHRKIIEQSFK